MISNIYDSKTKISRAINFHVTIKCGKHIYNVKGDVKVKNELRRPQPLGKRLRGDRK